MPIKKPKIKSSQISKNSFNKPTEKPLIKKPINLFSKKEKTPSKILNKNEKVDKIIPDTNKNNNKSTIFFAKNIDGNYLLPERNQLHIKNLLYK